MSVLTAVTSLVVRMLQSGGLPLLIDFMRSTVCFHVCVCVNITHIFP